MTEKALAARREYRRRYYEKNKERVRQWAERYWERCASQQPGEKDNSQEVEK